MQLMKHLLLVFDTQLKEREREDSKEDSDIKHKQTTAHSSSQAQGSFETLLLLPPFTSNTTATVLVVINIKALSPLLLHQERLTSLRTHQ
jgi:hypothetical protein